MPHFQYCSTIWHFCGAKNSGKLELLNKHALRIILGDNVSTYEVLLEKLDLVGLSKRRFLDMLNLVYKSFQAATPAYITALLTPRTNTNGLRGRWEGRTKSRQTGPEWGRALGFVPPSCLSSGKTPGTVLLANLSQTCDILITYAVRIANVLSKERISGVTSCVSFELLVPANNGILHVLHMLFSLLSCKMPWQSENPWRTESLYLLTTQARQAPYKWVHVLSFFRGNLLQLENPPYGIFFQASAWSLWHF